MPPKEVTPSIGEQLAEALENAGVSQKELARRIAGPDRHEAESKRRWILKVLRGDVVRPNMAEVEAALSLPAGHFVIPAPAQQEDRRVRLEELQAEVERLRKQLDDFVAATTARLADLEDDRARRAQR